MHYRRWRKHGDVHYLNKYQVLRMGDIETRFLSKVSVLPNGCWRWVADARSARGGYGVFTLAGVDNVLAHRWAFEHWVGPIPDGHYVDHFRYPQDGCIGPPCVNPEHLRPATPRENVLRGDTFAARNAAKTHCKRGHPLSGDNLRIGTRGNRLCRCCARLFARERRARTSVSPSTLNPLTN
jgi:hypothetical protein